MKIRNKIAAMAIAGVGALGLAAGVAVPALAGSQASSLAYELDNGATWMVTGSPAMSTSSNPDVGYADAGVVVDLGNASSFTGITQTGSANLAQNVWLIAPGHSLADMTGTSYPLGVSNLPDGFTYGLGDGNGGFYMNAGGGPDLTPAQIAAAYPGYEVFAWVGVVYYGGGTSVQGNVTSINGHSTGNRQLAVTTNGTSLVSSAK